MKMMLLAGLMITLPAIAVMVVFAGRSLMLPALASFLVNLIPFVVAGYLLSRRKDGDEAEGHH